MLVYNYGSKSFPLKNLQEIMVYLIRKVVARQSALPGHEFNITIYLFSIYQKELEVTPPLSRSSSSTNKSVKIH